MGVLAKVVATFDLTAPSNYKNADPIARYFEKRKNSLDKKIKQDIKGIIAEFFKRNKVYQALVNPDIGVLGEDLPAEFGLTDSEAKITAGSIINKLVECFELDLQNKNTIDPRKSRFEPGLKYLWPSMYEDWFIDSLKYNQVEGLKKLPKFTGKSAKNKNQKRKDRISELTEQGGGYIIHYGKWMMNPRSRSVLLEDLPDIGNYGICYDLKGGEIGYSKSGRALMKKFRDVKNKETGEKESKLDPRVTHFPYEIPAVLKPYAGEKNFVSSVAHLESFQNKIFKSMISNISKEINKG